MNKEKAINSFLGRIEQLTRLPLITDSEMNELFGEEVAAALATLNRYNIEEKICQRCENRCCYTSRCELYAPQFSECPIYGLRPVVCRLHFCHRFEATCSSLIVELGDIFFDSLLAAERNGSDRVRLFDTPPLEATSPQLVAVTSPWVDAVREGRLGPGDAGRLICREVAEHRLPVP